MALIDDVKKSLRVIHSFDDDYLQRLINAASIEYIQFCNIEVDSDQLSAPINEDAFQGIAVRVEGWYAAPPEKWESYRDAAETLWMPYRKGLGL